MPRYLIDNNLFVRACLSALVRVRVYVCVCVRVCLWNAIFISFETITDTRVATSLVT